MTVCRHGAFSFHKQETSLDGLKMLNRELCLRLRHTLGIFKNRTAILPQTPNKHLSICRDKRLLVVVGRWRIGLWSPGDANPVMASDLVRLKPATRPMKTSRDVLAIGEILVQFPNGWSSPGRSGAGLYSFLDVF